MCVKLLLEWCLAIEKMWSPATLSARLCHWSSSGGRFPGKGQSNSLRCIHSGDITHFPPAAASYFNLKWSSWRVFFKKIGVLGPFNVPLMGPFITGDEVLGTVVGQDDASLPINSHPWTDPRGIRWSRTLFASPLGMFSLKIIRLQIFITNCRVFFLLKIYKKKKKMPKEAFQSGLKDTFF